MKLFWGITSSQHKNFVGNFDGLFGNEKNKKETGCVVGAVTSI
jgi:hypothetical protein